MSVPAHKAPITPITAEVTLEQLIADRVSLAADAEYIKDRIEQIDAAILAQLNTTGTHDVGGVKVQIREYTRTDYTALAKKYPVEQFPALYKTEVALDQDQVKKQFAPAALDEFKVTGKKSVVVK